MEDLINSSEKTLVQKALAEPDSLPSYIWQLDKLLSATNQRIQALVSEYYSSILNNQSNLQELGTRLKSLLKKAQSLQNRSKKLSSNLTDSYTKLKSTVDNLEKVQAAGELAKHLQQYLYKLRKSPSSAELPQLKQKLKGILIIES